MIDGTYFGLMSGTSMDGVDGIAARFDDSGTHPQVCAEIYLPFPPELRAELFALQAPGADEIDREARAANALADVYAQCCEALLEQAALPPADVRAVGVHGQTIRHRPDQQYTRQIQNAARLAERIGIDVIADFRSRDVAAGGQGAPLAPGFHATVFSRPGATHVVCNIGGISNITVLKGEQDALGFDCGPGNALLDYWAQRHLGQPFDADGQFAASGTVDPQLLDALLDEPFFKQTPPKSTGRDLFNPDWFEARLNRSSRFGTLPPANVQATLMALTARTIIADVVRYAPGCEAIYVCGGGARNGALLAAMRSTLAAAGHAGMAVESTAALGVPPHQVETLAFAWLAMRFVNRQAGNLPSVTGAKGSRVLGALYPR